MTTAAQAARSETVDDELLKAYLASRPEDYPTPPLNQAAAQFLDEAFEKKATGDGFCTGYYEPELNGVLNRHGPYIHPIYRKPPDLTPDRPYHDRKAISDGALNGQGLELAWLRDPVEAFFLHIQGSGRVRLDNGQVMRVGFAGKNGHAYQSIGKILVERGLFALEDVTAQALKDWLADHPEDAERLMNENSSYVFFDARPELTETDGPIGTAGVPLTLLVSVAADPQHHPLGSLIHIEHHPATGLKNGYAIVQDTGGAIKGAGRIDLFTGSGDEAGDLAGALKHPVRVTTFAPRKAPT